MGSSLRVRNAASLLALDALFTPLISFSFASIVGIETEVAQRTFAQVVAQLFVVKVLLWLIVSQVALAPLDRWAALPDVERVPARIASTLRAAYGAPFVIAAAWAFGYALEFVAMPAILYLNYPDEVPLGREIVAAAGFAVAAVIPGALQLTFPLVEWLLSPVTADVSLSAYRCGLPMKGARLSFRARLSAFALCLAVAPCVWMGGMTYMTDVRALYRERLRLAELLALEVARNAENGAGAVALKTTTLEEAHPFLTSRDSPMIEPGAATELLGRSESLGRRLRSEMLSAERGRIVDRRSGLVTSFTRLPDGRIAGVVLGGRASATEGTTISVAAFLFIVAIWAPLSALFIARSTAQPVSRISAALARVREGQIAATEHIPVLHPDEVGVLSWHFNAVLDQLRVFADGARRIARGDLAGDIDVPGELGDCFRAQAASLRGMVSQISESAKQLAVAAAEIYAAVEAQETSAQEQSRGVNEVTRAMDSLLSAASHASESTLDVLSKAEGAHERTSRTAERMGELSRHASRIGEILDVIQEIADRSDLLALNAALEGTRAGESGRAFGLLAAEMRRLAERVTGSIVDVKSLVRDVSSSVSLTVTSTEESQEIAAGTSVSARKINRVIQEQRSSTEKAGESMRSVESLITHSLTSTRQIRDLANNLKTHADGLADVVSRFRIEPTRDRPSKSS